MFLSRFIQWTSCSSENEDPPELPVGSLIACDITEMFYILNSKTTKEYGVEIVELCGGRGHTSYLCIRRQLVAGHNFKLVTGCDLTDNSTQAKVLGYLDVARPLVVVMGPTCGPFGPLGRWNRSIHPDGWARSMEHAQPLAAFCGKVALRQIRNGRHFLCEQPQSSELFAVEPWPLVVNDPQVLSVVFHQCRVKQYVNGLLCRKATELVASAIELLKPFEGLVCQGDHPHASLVGGQAVKAQKWSHNMCERIAHGIEKLAKKAKLRAYPTVGTSAEPPDPSAEPAAEDESGELWRKCKGCRWRRPKDDPSHSRERGICKHPDIAPHKFECPGCVAHRPRNNSSHTFGPDCRHSLTTPRTGTRRRPYSRVPAEEEPTSGLRGSDLGVEDERDVEEQLDRAVERPSPAEEPNPLEGVFDDEEQPAAAEPASASSGRGPDIVPRVRRTFREGEAQTPITDDWTSFDVSSALRGLRHADEAGRRRILRKLHLRWWHASAERMRRLLKTASISKETLDLIPAIVDTCRVCRLWSKPGTDSVPSNRLVTGFNVEVEGDLIFYRHQGSQHVILHLVDRGVRWASAWVIPDRTTESILTGIDQWISTFGPMQVLIFDGETGLSDDQATQYFELKGITKRTAAVGQHVRICDRRTQVLRDILHKIATQLSEEGLVVSLQRVLAEAVFALNALTSVNGCSPYTAVLGRIPPILPESLAVPDDSVSDPTTAHVHRLREIAIQAIVEGTARERMKRALHTPTRVAHQELEFKVGETVEYWRQPENKEASGWRGPAVVCDLSRLEHGRIGIRTRADNVLTCRIQDVRRCLAYAVDIVSPETSSGGVAQQHIQHHIECMSKGVTLVLGSVRSPQGSWTTTTSTSKHHTTFEASMCLASVVFQLSNTAAVRLRQGVRNLSAKPEFANSTLLFWTEAYSKAIEYVHSEQTAVNFVGLVGQEWTKVRFIQFLQVTEEDEYMIKPPEDDIISNSSSGNATAQDTGRSMSIGGPLSTIPEGTSEGDDSHHVTWEELQEAFGVVPPEDEAQVFAEVLVALEAETTPVQPPSATQAFVANGEIDPEMFETDLNPEWSYVSHVLETEFGMSDQLTFECFQVLQTREPEIECDDLGNFVALECSENMWKCLPDVPRPPQQGETVVLRIYQTHTRKAVIERSDDLLTSEETHVHAAEVMQAMVDELRTWQKLQCFERKAKSKCPCIIDAKWVLKWKFRGETRTIRARLCLRGFKEHGADHLSNYSATASRLSQRLLVSETVLRDWQLASTDVPKAFLQGVTYSELAEMTKQPERSVAFILGSESVPCLRMLSGYESFDPRTECLSCLKPGTGCRDAPRAFSLKLRGITSKFGFKSSFLDSELEYLQHPDGTPRLLLLKHVDDLKMAGSKSDIESVVAYLAKEFGELSVEWNTFTFCGVRHTQQDGEVVLDQTKFIAAIKEMEVPKQPSEDLLSEFLRRQFLSLLMTVAYAMLTRIDAAVYVTALQRECHKAKVIHVKRLNLIVRWLQKNPRGLRYAKMQYPDALVQFSDSGFQARAEDGLSVRGMVSLRMHSSDIKQSSKAIVVHLLEYCSKGQRHVTRSTFSSELFAGTDAIDAGLLSRLALHELKFGSLDANVAREILEGKRESPIQLHAILDAKSVTAAVAAPVLKTPAEAPLMVHIRWLREHLSRRTFSELWWTDTRSMLADALTKGSIDRSALIQLMNGKTLIEHPISRCSMTDEDAAEV